MKRAARIAATVAGAIAGLLLLVLCLLQLPFVQTAVSNAVLDAILAQDAMGRVACETCVTTGMVLCMGEITTTADIDIPKIARQVVIDIGYDRAKFGFDGKSQGTHKNK